MSLKGLWFVTLPAVSLVFTGTIASGRGFVTRSPSSALLPFLFWGRVSLLKQTKRKTVGTLILASLLDDLGL